MSASSPASAAEAPARRWSQLAERGSLWGMQLTAWLYRRAGRRLCVVLVHGIVAYFFLTDPASRRASRAYLRRVHATPEGRRRLGRPPGAWQSFLHHRAFGLAIVDRLAIWFGRSGDFEFEVHGFEHVARHEAQGRGFLVLGAHLGSFDAMRLLARRQRRPVNVLMFTRHAERINSVFRRLSPDAETRVIRVDPDRVDTVFEIRRCLARGEHVAMLCDRVEPADRQRTSRVPLLGDPVELPQAPFLLAHLLGCPVLQMTALRRGPGRYEVFIDELAERVRLPRRGRDEALRELLSAYAARLEALCLEEPTQWFNFFDYWGDATAKEARP